MFVWNCVYVIQRVWKFLYSLPQLLRKSFSTSSDKNQRMTSMANYSDELQSSAQINIINGSNVTNATILLNTVDLASVQSISGTHYLSEKLWLTILLGVFLSATSICGVYGNILCDPRGFFSQIAFSVATDKFLRQPGNVFIINLALADLLIALIVDPFHVVGAVYGEEFYNKHHWLCVTVGAVCVPSCVASLLNIMAVSINRYVRICKYHHYHRIYSWRISIAMCVVVWACGIMIHFPNHVGWGNTGFDPDFYACAFNSRIYSYALFWLGLAVVIPLLVITFCYNRIFQHYKSAHAAVLTHSHPPVATKNTKHFVEKNSERKTSPAAGSSSARKKPANILPSSSSKDNDERKLLRSLLLVLAAFVVCWTPFTLLVAAGDPRWIPGWVYLLAGFMAHANSTANVFIYGFTNRHFRNAYKRLICRRGVCQSFRQGNEVAATNTRKLVTNLRVRTVDYNSTL